MTVVQSRQSHDDFLCLGLTIVPSPSAHGEFRSQATLSGSAHVPAVYSVPGRQSVGSVVHVFSHLRHTMQVTFPSIT